MEWITVILLVYFGGNLRVALKYANDKSETVFFLLLGMPSLLLADFLEIVNQWLDPDEY